MINFNIILEEIITIYNKKKSPTLIQTRFSHFNEILIQSDS